MNSQIIGSGLDIHASLILQNVGDRDPIADVGIVIECEQTSDELALELENLGSLEKSEQKDRLPRIQFNFSSVDVRGDDFFEFLIVDFGVGLGQGLKCGFNFIILVVFLNELCREILEEIVT